MKRLFFLVSSACALLVLAPVIAEHSGGSAAARPIAPADHVYHVCYVNPKKSGRKEYLYLSTTSYAKALKAVYFLNSFPQYVAYVR